MLAGLDKIQHRLGTRIHFRKDILPLGKGFLLQLTGNLRLQFSHLVRHHHQAKTGQVRTTDSGTELAEKLRLQPADREPATIRGFITVIEGTSIELGDRKSTRLNSSHVKISYAVFCLKKKKKQINHA